MSVLLVVFVFVKVYNCNIPHRIEEKVPSTIYVWTSFNLVGSFLSREGHLGSKQIISTQLGVGFYKWYQSQSSTSVGEFAWPKMGVHLFDPTILWDTIRMLCLHQRMIVISYITYGKKFLNLYIYILLLTLYTYFKVMKAT